MLKCFLLFFMIFYFQKFLRVFKFGLISSFKSIISSGLFLSSDNNEFIPFTKYSFLYLFKIFIQFLSLLSFLLALLLSFFVILDISNAFIFSSNRLESLSFSLERFNYYYFLLFLFYFHLSRNISYIRVNFLFIN